MGQGRQPRKNAAGLRGGVAGLGITGQSVAELLVHSGLCASKGQARKDIEGGGIYLNNRRLAEAGRTVSLADLLFGRYLLLRKGRRSYVLIRAQ